MFKLQGRRQSLRAEARERRWRANLPGGARTAAGRRIVCLLAALICGGVSLAETGPVAVWLFDEEAGAGAGSILADASPHGHFLVLGKDGELVAGKFGRALQPTTEATVPAREAHFVAQFTNAGDQSPPAPFPNVTDSPLNLGARDWTIECWLRIDPAARAEGVLFEVGAGRRGNSALVTRFSVLPAEDAFAMHTIAAASAGLVEPPRIELTPADGPAGHAVVPRTTTLSLAGGGLARGTWFHVALVHRAEPADFRLFIDGQARAVAAARIESLPHGREGYISVGCDGGGGRRLGGAIDELRVSDHAVYQGAFTPPTTLAPPRRRQRRARRSGRTATWARR